MIFSIGADENEYFPINVIKKRCSQSFHELKKNHQKYLISIFWKTLMHLMNCCNLNINEYMLTLHKLNVTERLTFIFQIAFKKRYLYWGNVVIKTLPESSLMKIFIQKFQI